MSVQVSLSQGQIDFLITVLGKAKDKRQKQIDKSTRPTQSAPLEILAIDDLITAFATAKPKSVELPVLEQLG